MSKCRVRVEMKRLPPHATKQDYERSLAILLKILKRACTDYGIPKMYKEHEFFERPTDKRRRKRMQAKLAAQLGLNKLENEQQESEW